MLYSAISLFLSKVGKNNKNWDQAKNKKQAQIKNDIRINIFNKDQGGGDQLLATRMLVTGNLINSTTTTHPQPVTSAASNWFQGK